MKMYIRIIAIIALTVTVFAMRGQMKPRVAGLESNEEYMGLLSHEAALVVQEDSLNKVVAVIRSLFREQPENRQTIRKDILRLEGEIFDVRNEVGIVASKLNMIENEFIISNLDGNYGTKADTTIVVADSIHHPQTFANLTDNDFFRLKLPPNDYKALLNAQSKENSLVNYLKIYLINYKNMSALSEQYHTVTNVVSADSLMGRYGTFESLNSVIADSISSTLGYIVENKTYAYNYLLDRLNKMDVLAEFDKKTTEARDLEVKMRQQAESGIVASYPIKKKLLLDYEKLFAQSLSLDKALDSLQRAEASLGAIDYSVPKLDMTERLFLDYADVEVHDPPKYNTSHPIPQCKVYEKGVICRVLVGTYTRVQPVSVFKGIYPLAYLKGEDNRLRYYAGGFETHSKAAEAVDRLKQLGFKNPEVAVWDYGIYTTLGGDAVRSDGKLFRVEISGAGDGLSAEIKDAIQNDAPGKDILRTGPVFVISSFDTATQAEMIAETIRTIDKKLSVKISEIPL